MPENNVHHRSLENWLQIESTLRPILRERGATEEELTDLFAWGQEKWIEVTDQDPPFTTEDLINMINAFFFEAIWQRLQVLRAEDKPWS